MGQNSTEVSYGFGQMGSAHCKTANSVYPPKGMVIVAVQFIAANIPTVLRPEADSTAAYEEFQCFHTEGAAHNNGDAQQALTNAASNTTHTLTGANAAIEVGMEVIGNDTQGNYMGVDKAVGVNRNPIIVTAVSGTSITFNRAITASTTTLTFSHATGDGGEDASGCSYPTGSVIYGRWTEVKPAADPDGGVICYFGY
jgi:hypothetical protein